MSIEINAILDGIAEAGQQQISEIKNAAENEVGEIHSRVEAETNLQKNRLLKAGQARLNRTRALLEQQAIMHVLQLHADARQRLIEKALKKTKEKISIIRNDDRYLKILKMLILNAVDALKPSLLEGQKVILHFDKRDKAIAGDLIKELDELIIPMYDISCQGGCIAESEDGLVSTHNTLESRFQHSLPFTQQTLSIFFERKISTS